MADNLLEVTGLRVHFDTPDGVARAVDGVSYELGPGETLGVVGESGSGKSVAALAIMRLIPSAGRIEGGDVLLRGQSLLAMKEDEIRRIRGNDIAMIFQDPMMSLNPVNRIGHQIAEQVMSHKGMTRKEAMAHAVELLELVGIPQAAARLRDYPHQFSGGMRQRVMIAMAVSCDPAILIADEPTTALDVTIQAQVLELMECLQKRTGMAIILISHDLGVAADAADNVLVMYAGRAVEFGTCEEVFYRPSHPYTWGLMDSIPRYDADAHAALCPIAGQPPSLINVPTGCAFHPRCQYAKEVCRVQEPPVRSVGGRHTASCHFAGDPGFARGASACTGVSAGWAS